MSEQTYRHHTHHPVLTYVTGLFAAVALAAMVEQQFRGRETRDLAIWALVGAVFVLGTLTRQSTTALQDRIIMLEMKIRCAELLPAGQDTNLQNLSTTQIVALRFASDEELGALLERAVREKLSPNDIKASIRTWRPDPHRT